MTMLMASLVYLLKATAILLLATVAAFLLRRAPAGTRHTLWLAAMMMVVVLPLVEGVMPQWKVLPIGGAAPPVATQQWTGAMPSDRSPQPDGATLTDRAPRADDPALARGAAIHAELSGAPSAGARGGISLPAGGLSFTGLLAGLWLAGALALLGRLLLSTVVLRRILADAEPATGHGWTTPLWEAADRLDLADAPRLLLSDRITMPFAAGLLRPAIVLPRAAAQWSDDRRRAVLLHELAHVRRRDLLSHMLGRIACCLYWMHPMVWAAARRLRAESERACDDLVLNAGTPASDYADHLLQILVGGNGSGAPTVALAMGRRREIEGRLLAILDPALRRRSPALLQTAVVGGLGAAAVATLAIGPADAAPSRGWLPEPQTLAPPAEAHTAQDSAGTDAGPGEQVAIFTDSVVLIATPDAGGVVVSVIEGARPVPRGARAESWGVGEIAAGAGLPREVADDPKNIPLLIRLLATDPSPEVRRTAAWGLSGAADPTATAALARALAEDAESEVREMAAWALVGTDAVTALVAAAGDESASVRRTAVWALGSSRGEGGAAFGALVAALDDPDAEVRLRGAWGLGTWRPGAAPGPLYESALHDEDPEVRTAAAWALGQIGDSASLPALQAAVRTESSGGPLKAVVWALTEFGALSSTALEPLIESEDAELRALAVRGAAGIPGRMWPWPWPWPDPRPFP